jgi:hypothetical protein
MFLKVLKLSSNVKGVFQKVLKLSSEVSECKPLPSATSTCPLATAAALPLELPPGIQPGGRV